MLAAGVQNTDALAFADRSLFTEGAGPTRAIVQMGGVLGALNNTPLVAMFARRVQAWCERLGTPPSKITLSASYATTAGGSVTLIGTSINLVVSGLMVDTGAPAPGLFTAPPVALPAALAALGAMALVSHRLLPDRRAGRVVDGDGLRACLFEVHVPACSSLVGRTLREVRFRER